MVRPSGKDINFWAYVEIFTKGAWVGLILVIVSCAGGLFLLAQRESLHIEPDSEHFGYLNGLAVVIIAVMQRSYPLVPHFISGRTLYFMGRIGRTIYCCPSPRF